MDIHSSSPELASLCKVLQPQYPIRHFAVRWQVEAQVVHIFTPSDCLSEARDRRIRNGIRVYAKQFGS